ncbi:MAG: hypothetical protein WC607_04315 [Candidatus Micrarchaeia archaeon]
MPLPAKRIEKPAPSAPQAAPKEHEIRIALPVIHFRFGEHFKRRLPLLAIVVVLFVFSCIIFDKANLRVLDLFDLTRIATVAIPKLFSWSFLLFGFLFALALAFAMFYAHGLEPATALLIFPVTLIPALALWMFIPALGLAFAAFSLTLGIAAFLASREREFEWHRAWTAMRRALTVLLVCAVMVSAVKCYVAQEGYANILFTSAEVLITKDAQFSGLFSGGSVPMVTRDQIDSALTVSDVEEVLDGSSALSAVLGNASAQTRELIATQIRQGTVDKTYEKLTAELQAGQLPVTEGGSGLISYYAKSSALGQAITNSLWLIVVPVVWFLGSAALLFVRILGVLAWFALSKL